MDRRTKILSISFGAIMLGALIYKVVYPVWIEPLTTLDERIAVASRELDELREKQNEVRQAKADYRDFIERVGSFDPAEVENELRDKLSDLIKKHKLKDDNTSRSRGKPDRKTKIVKSKLTVKGVTDLASAVGFLKDLAELPELIRIEKPSITPVRSARKSGEKGQQLVSITVPIDFWVLPQDRMVGRLEKADLIQPERVVRHMGRDYSQVWQRHSFTEVIPPPPLVASTGRDVTVEQNMKALVTGSAKGGTPPYQYSWAPADKVDNPSIARPSVNSEVAGAYKLLLSVTDSEGRVAKSNVKVNVRPGRGTKAGGKPPSQPKDKRWRDRKYMQLAMTLTRTEGDRRIGEVMIHNKKNKETTYYSEGDEFNGGELVFVHSRGGLVFLEGAYYVYPIGERLDVEVSLEDSEDYPRFRLAADKHRAQIAASLKTPAESAKESPKEATRKPGEPKQPVKKGGGVPSQRPDRAKGGATSPARKPTARPPAAVIKPSGKKPGSSKRRIKPPGQATKKGKTVEQAPSDSKDAKTKRQLTSKGKPQRNPRAKGAETKKPARKGN